MCFEFWYCNQPMHTQTRLYYETGVAKSLRHYKTQARAQGFVQTLPEIIEELNLSNLKEYCFCIYNHCTCALHVSVNNTTNLKLFQKLTFDYIAYRCIWMSQHIVKCNIDIDYSIYQIIEVERLDWVHIILHIIRYEHVIKQIYYSCNLHMHTKTPLFRCIILLIR